MMRYIVTGAIFFLLSAISWAASHHPQDFLKRIAGSKNEGKEIVKHYCAMCHAEKPMIQLGAPRTGQMKDWEPRMKLGTARIWEHTTEGLNAMPARGGCFECTDQQLLLAINALLPHDLRLKNAPTKDHKLPSK